MMAKAIQPIDSASAIKLPKVVTSYSYNSSGDMSPLDPLSRLSKKTQVNDWAPAAEHYQVFPP